MTIEIKTTSKGDYYFLIKHLNGQVIIESEKYLAKAAVLNAIDSLKSNIKNAKVIDE